MLQRILLASHGSVGGIAAEQEAINACNEGDELDHLYVIPSWWASMTGDDWLNNGVTRNRFRNYLTEELGRESQLVIKRIHQLCMQHKIKYKSLLQVGCSDVGLKEAADKKEYQKIIIGNRRPKHVEGIHDHMLTPRIRKQLGKRLHIVSHPHG